MYEVFVGKIEEESLLWINRLRCEIEMWHDPLDSIRLEHCCLWLSDWHRRVRIFDHYYQKGNCTRLQFEYSILRLSVTVVKCQWTNEYSLCQAYTCWWGGTIHNYCSQCKDGRTPTHIYCSPLPSYAGTHIMLPSYLFQHVAIYIFTLLYC